jgi:YbgC/YbaW family acyl-CoA thioester hydrolase
MEMLSYAKELPKVLESTATVRFQDCDPFNHLNNARYLDYFLNAREDQLVAHYGFDVYQLAASTGMGWVVGRSQIAYLKPAKLMEEVVIQSQLIQVGERDLHVEMRMLDKDKTHLKALLWTNFVHFRIATGRAEKHNLEYMAFFSRVVNPVEASSFDMRFTQAVSMGQVATAV